ncbi:MAG TPA: M20/M25/M40 family metallo-hydrolase [Terrimesophilobacter sp.]|nr:M20/M25/M40 family metallo-hydrolase [Terrimesophilobacter sp.]
MAHEPAVERLRELISIPTISRPDEAEMDFDEFERFIGAIERLYPLVHKSLERERVAGHSLLFRWPGSGDGPASVLMAHYDVVAATDDGWEHPPFAAVVTGESDERVLWGRGTLDDKGALTCVLESVESLLAEGFTPAADVYLSFGHNEETAGNGAVEAVELLGSRGIRPRFVLDEGGAVVEGVFPGVAAPIAVIGVSEKGITTLRLTVEERGGHASMPPRDTATARLARAIVRLNSRPHPAALSATNIEMLKTVGAHAKGVFRFLFTQTWLTRGILKLAFAQLSEETAAMIRTTQAVTMLRAGLAENALAEKAVATVNIRVAAGSRVAEAVEHVRRAVRDERVTIEVTDPSEPSPVSPTSGEQWESLRSAIEQAYPGTVVTPYVMLGASDARRFTAISDHVYRFSPFEMSKAERDTLHAKNERMRVVTFLRGIEFYRALVRGL